MQPRTPTPDTTLRMAAEHYGWTRIPFLKDGKERDVDEKNREIYSILLDAINE